LLLFEKYSECSSYLSEIIPEVLNLIQNCSSNPEERNKYDQQIIQEEESCLILASSVTILYGQSLEQLKEYSKSLEVFRKAEEIYIITNGYFNKEVSQVKRRIINIYLSMQDLKEAVDELDELKNIDRSIYGKFSNIVARNYKLRGILELAFCNSDNSMKFLGKAYKIF
jgi:tetratricopeptide (TPR) repeat protein